MDTKASPLKAKPLRLPGQSLQEQIDKIVDEDLMQYAMVTLVLILLAGLEWYRYLTKAPPQAFLATIIAICAVIYTTIKFFRIRKHVRALKLGRDGEKAVGQFLELLREEGCIVFHDIVGDNFNLDHVVISEKGIYLIETKTYSKPNRVKPQVHYKQGKLTIDGLGDKSEILTQVRAAATWLTRMLEESTGKTFLIKPVILFPGWMVDSNDHSDIWVLEPKGFPKFLANRQPMVTKEDKKLAGYHLSRYIRA